jgi:hypothetical protein
MNSVGKLDMQAELHPPILKEKEIAVAFNMGLQTAVYVLEKAEELSAEGRRFLI